MQMLQEPGEVSQLYSQTAIEARAVTPEQIDNAEEIQQLFNVTYHVDRHLAFVVPDLSEEDRRTCAAEIAPICNGEGVAEACRRYANDLTRSALTAEFEAKKLGERNRRNDVGNGERFAKEYIDEFKFLDDRKVWVRWDGKRWRDAQESEIYRAAKKVAKDMLDEALKNENKDDQAWAFSSLSRRALGNMIACAASEKTLTSNTKKFDQNPNLLTVENGTIDLSTGRLYVHAREDMITTLTPIRYDPDAKCPRWDQFLLEVFNNDMDLIAFMQRGTGYSMTGHTREHAFFVLWGGGRNGKGTFIRQIMSLPGDAARTTGFKTFTVGREEAGGNTPALASLAGARLVVAGEPDEGVRLSESVIKSLTGEDEISVCQKYERPFRYMPAFKIWLHCNHKPSIRGTDMGIWSRPRLIPFNVSFMTVEEAAASKTAVLVRKDPDKKLDEKLKLEREGILAWAVRGSVEWYRSGLGTCTTVRTETERYRDESDRLGPFIEECFKIDPNAFISNDKLCEAYSAWCKRNLVQHEMTGQTLSKQITGRGYVRGKDKGVRGFKGIALVSPGTLFTTPAKG